MWYLELQQAITYSKMTLGTLEQGGNMYKVNNKGTGTTLNFEQVNIDQDISSTWK